jgi:RimJ/RimL family protein N-acetyltransferase
MAIMLVLAGNAVTLEALGEQHVEGLLKAAIADRSSYGFVPVPANESEMTAYVRAAVEEAAEGRQVPFAIVLQSESQIVGATRFAELSHWPSLAHLRPAADPAFPDAVEIGYTWLTALAQRTVVNTESKFMLLNYAFEVWGVHRVRFRTDVRNSRSRQAIERLGAKLDGVMRADWPSADGVVRDSAIYSIVSSEWPSVRRRLLGSLSG